MVLRGNAFKGTTVSYEGADCCTRNLGTFKSRNFVWNLGNAFSRTSKSRKLSANPGTRHTQILKVLWILEHLTLKCQHWNSYLENVTRISEHLTPKISNLFATPNQNLESFASVWILGRASAICRVCWLACRSDCATTISNSNQMNQIDATGRCSDISFQK